MTQLGDVEFNASPVGKFDNAVWKERSAMTAEAYQENAGAGFGSSSINGRVNEIPIEVEAVIGRSSLSVAELMHMGPGDFLRLNRRFGEPIELRVNGRIIGYGELAADDYDNIIGIRMTKLTGVS